MSSDSQRLNAAERLWNYWQRCAHFRPPPTGALTNGRFLFSGLTYLPEPSANRFNAWPNAGHLLLVRKPGTINDTDNAYPIIPFVAPPLWTRHTKPNLPPQQPLEKIPEKSEGLTKFINSKGLQFFKDDEGYIGRVASRAPYMGQSALTIFWGKSWDLEIFLARDFAQGLTRPLHETKIGFGQTSIGAIDKSLDRYNKRVWSKDNKG